MVLGVHMCFVMVVFVFVLFFFLVRDPFILAHAIGALLYLCIYWSVQHKKKKKKKKKNSRITHTTPTGNIPEAPELGTPRYNGQNVGSQWCPL